MTQLQTLNAQTLIDLLGDEPQAHLKFRISFLQQAQTSLKKLVLLYNKSEFNELKEEAHYLKTSAKAIGAEKVAHALQQLEEYALKNKKVQCKQLIQNINAEVKLVYKECKQ